MSSSPTEPCLNRMGKVRERQVFTVDFIYQLATEGAFFFLKLAQKCRFALNYIPTSFRVTYYDNFGIRVKMWNYHFIIFKFREGNKA